MKNRTSRWHAVMVVLHNTSCAAATLCRNKRFLSQEAPRLPLPDCQNSEQCQCVYRHFEDRRLNPRRTADMTGALPAGETPKTNRRLTRGRRAQDKN